MKDQLTDEYIKKLKKLLQMKKISSYEVAHASYRKAYSYSIIDSTDKRELTITFINGDTREFKSFNKFMNEIKKINESYKVSRRKYINRYYNVIGKWNSRRRNNNSTDNKLQKLIEKYQV